MMPFSYASLSLPKAGLLAALGLLAPLAHAAEPAKAPAPKPAVQSTLPEPDTPSVSLSPAKPTRFAPPPADQIPDDEFGEMVRKGEQIFLNTQKHAKQFVGNRLNCVNCHLDAGRKAGSGPLWGAFISYPAYRSKNQHVNTYTERLQGCFSYSMNGKAPPAGHEVLVALETYSYWLSTGAPVRGQVEGRGYPAIETPPKPGDYARGEKVYQQQCALCHGDKGQGQLSGGQTVFPPLWGAESFNWGAGMHDVKTAASFIKANMPLGKGGTLSTQEAWDVATFMNSHERPQDPRFTGSVAQTRKKYHDTPTSLYGKSVNGHVLGGK